MTTLAQAACAVLTAPDPAEKLRLSAEIGEDWRAGRISEIGHCPPPDRPARPAQPELLPPNRMPKRSYGGVAGRIALMHSLAHIELVAIDLAWDIIARFTHEDLPKGFYDDWVEVAVEEAEHFRMLDAILRDLGSFYGALPAHDGLWQAATKTAHDLRARLAVVPMTLEARGLDTTPTTIERLRANGDLESIAPLEVIFRDEIKHVAAGTRWFDQISRRLGEDPVDAFHRIHRANFPGGLKAPFNHEARLLAGMDRNYYEPLAK